MPDLAPFPDPSAMLLDDLADLGETGVKTPDDLQSKDKFIRVLRLPSGESTQTQDVALMEILVFAPTYAVGRATAEAVRQRMISAARVVAGVGVLPIARTETTPHEVPYEDPAIRAFLAVYRIATRR